MKKLKRRPITGNFIMKSYTLSKAAEESNLPLQITMMGLLACCDPAGRFEWDVPWLKENLLPFNPVDMNQVLDALLACGAIQRYEFEGQVYGFIVLPETHPEIPSVGAFESMTVDWMLQNKRLFELEHRTQLPIRMMLLGLLAYCDQEGDFEWDLEWFQANVLPFQSVDMLKLFETLSATGLIKQYELDGEFYGCVMLPKRTQPSSLLQSTALMPVHFVFKSKVLTEAESKTQLPLKIMMLGLLASCDVDGQFEWDLPWLKTKILPFDALDIVKVFEVLLDYGALKHYEKDGQSYGCIVPLS